MHVVTGAAEAQAIVGDRGSVVTIGAYDGVHLGHRAIIDEVRHLADTRGALSAMVTFDRHPATVVRPESAPCRLTSLEQRLELLAATGLDLVLVITFDEERSRETAEDFVTEVLVDGLHARAIVVGHDFHFGANRGGNVEMLQRAGAKHGFDVLGMRLVATGREAVSSTRIRQLLHDGEVASAAALLGRPHEVRGTVMRGDARGRELGFPTANVKVPDGVCMPADGIYAALYTGAGRHRTPGRGFARSTADVLRRRARVAARGVRARLRRRPLRPARRGRLRRTAPRRATLRQGRRPDQANARRRRRHPSRPRPMKRGRFLYLPWVVAILAMCAIGPAVDWIRHPRRIPSRHHASR